MLQMIEKESLHNHRKIGQVKRCDEEFCLHFSEVTRISKTRSNESRFIDYFSFDDSSMIVI